MRRPRGFARFVGGQGFHCLFLAGVEDGTSVKIGIANDALLRHPSLKAASAGSPRLHQHWWLAGKPVALRIKKFFGEAFASRRIHGDWFRVSLTEAETFVEHAINDLGTWGASEAEMIAEMQRRVRKGVGAAFRA